MPAQVNTLSQFAEGILPYAQSLALRIVACLLIWFIGRKAIRFATGLMRKISDKHRIDPTVSRFLESLVRWGLYALICYLIIENLGVSSSSFLALFTSAGLAVGLAVQGSLSNFAGGVLILLLRPFKVGDYIIEDTHKNEGTVRSIDLFYTTLTTVDNRTIVIPNGTLSNSSLTNVTAQKERQLILSIPVSYDCDIRLAKQLIEQCIAGHEEIIRTPEKPVLVVMADMKDSSIELQARMWLPSASYWPLKWALNEEIKTALDENGIQIPFPQLDVHVK